MVRVIQSSIWKLARRLAACGFCWALLVQAVLAQAPTLRLAPLNPEFIAWQKERATPGFERTYLRDEEGRALGHIPSPFDWSHLRSESPEAPPREGQPSSYDLRTLGHVTGVRSQGGCGSCWAFATYGSLESWLLKDRGETWDLSENHLKNYHDFDWGPCDGGNSDMSTAYLARWSGPVDESDDPYHDWDDRPSPGGPCQKYLRSALRFSTSSDMKNAVMTYGALYTSMRWQSASYNSSEYTYYYHGMASTNHAVAIVGWDDNKVVTGAPGNGAWIAKNSWGTSFGESGYFYISYYDTKAATYGVAFCDARSTAGYITNYQYDPLGKTNSGGYGDNTAWGANIFTATADGDLGAVGFHANTSSTAYEVYVYDDFSGGTFSNLLQSATGTVAYAGYHTINLPSPVTLTNGDDFGIVVKFTTPGYTYPIPMEEPVADYASGATANAGESYVSHDGTTFTDITTYFPDTNVCIKGLTVDTETLAAISYVKTTGSDAELLVEWETEAEVGTAGFNVLRAESPEGPWLKLNEELIPSQGSSWEGASYDFSDTTREAGTVYWYCVEEVETGGGTERYASQLVWDEGLTDADGDGMPDVWEKRLGIDSGNEADASADPDGDGATNLQEYVAGTSPTDGQESARLSIEAAGEREWVVLSWTGRPGRAYTLLSADSLAELIGGPAEAVPASTATSNGPMRFQVPLEPGVRRRFYRLIISPPQ